MRVGINARFMDAPATGSGQHVGQLIEALREHGENTYTLLSPGAPQRANSQGLMAARLRRLWWEQVAVVRAAREQRVDLLHVPYFAAPLVRPAPTIVTIHDLIPLLLAEYRERWINRLYTALVSLTARLADAVIAVSECSRQDVVRVLRIPPERVHVIPNAIDDARYRPVEDPELLRNVRQRYGIPEQYILYFGGFDIRKNVYRLLEAYASLSGSLRQEYPLVLAGRLHLLGHPLYPDPRPRAASLGLAERVVVTGEVAEEDKPALYSGATLFLWPSLYEGFGIPVLEAMACGVPVITSDGSALPEVTGSAARLVDPRDVRAIAGAMAELLEDPGGRHELSQLGLERSRRFRWRDVAERTCEVYRAAAG